ncbi:hypothetical protein [Blastopirellula marina]|uniref:Lipocalin-like domain-containing protein n=1 Tax=Blastopirellula marina TaxID=124 RepID=A0A2S8F9I0_9BACT|nr:hypothetical protein [Blastopirellula marina]PQO28790.1 hypothetical protein C5Y98_23720 [Blastopirellula marina]PTL42063.1 hypothetical protein C5Y97_23735 [Blastopirellula marina]
MSDDHQPIDAKDDSPEYRKQVWEAVSQRVESALMPLPTGSSLDGTWKFDLDMLGTRLPFATYAFGQGNSVVISQAMSASDGPTSETYRIPSDGRIELAGEVYHAATTTQGELVLFNGDQSLVLVATRQ